MCDSLIAFLLADAKEQEKKRCAPHRDPHPGSTGPPRSALRGDGPPLPSPPPARRSVAEFDPKAYAKKGMQVLKKDAAEEDLWLMAGIGCPPARPLGPSSPGGWGRDENPGSGFQTPMLGRGDVGPPSLPQLPA